MGFSEFQGNAETVHRLREMLAQTRLLIVSLISVVLTGIALSFTAAHL